VPELTGRTIGLVGFGNIGSLVAKKLSGFDVRVLVYDPYTDPEVLRANGVEPASLETVLSEADIVSLHARLSDESKGMIGAEQLALMKPTAILINTARAGLVDEAALVETLRENRIAGAALDVFSTEPIPADSPFLELDNVTLTTHLAGTTADALSNSPFLLMEDIAKLLTGGQPRFLKNPEVLDDPRFADWLAAVKQG